MEISTAGVIKQGWTIPRFLLQLYTSNFGDVPASWHHWPGPGRNSANDPPSTLAMPETLESQKLLAKVAKKKTTITNRSKNSKIISGFLFQQLSCWTFYCYLQNQGINLRFLEMFFIFVAWPRLVEGPHDPIHAIHLTACPLFRRSWKNPTSNE